MMQWRGAAINWPSKLTVRWSPYAFPRGEGVAGVGVAAGRRQPRPIPGGGGSPGHQGIVLPPWESSG